MKTKDVHVLNWEKFTLYTSKTNSSKNSEVIARIKELIEE